MSKKAKILTILSRVPFPLEKGDKLRAYYQIKELQKELDVVLVCLTFKTPTIEQKKALENICYKVYFIELKKWRLPFEMVKSLWDGLPFQVHYFYQNQAQKEFDRIIQKEQPKKIFAQLVRTYKYIEPYCVLPVHLDFMDAFSTGMERRSLASKNPVKKKIFEKEFLALRNFEKKAVSDVTKAYIISEQDRSSMEMEESLEILPNGVDLDFFQSENQPKKYDLLFTGNMSYPPNVMAAQYIVKKILPELQKTHPDISVCIAGANPANAVKQLAGKQVVVTGWMDDIREAYNASKIFVAPMKIGTGLQNKLLEAMSMELPCISSSLANNALGARDNDEILIADSLKDWIDQIELLLSNDQKRNVLGKAGNRMIIEKYSWKNNTFPLLEGLKK